MADRKSDRIKTRKKINYQEDDFDYELHLDVSNDISNILKSHTQPKSKESSGRSRKSFPHVSKKIVRKGKTDEHLAFPDGGVGSLTGNSISSSVKIPENGMLSQDCDFQDASQVICPICNEHMTSDKEMDEHLLKHQSDSGRLNGGYVCNICNRICVDLAAYNRHIKSHAGNRKYKCHICDKAFAESCSLKRHMKTHEDDRPFLCDICFKSFREHASLIRHHKTHTDRPRMYQCVKCDKNFADKHSLKRHERTHTGIRPFECQICFKTFSESGSFKRHEKIHTGIRSYFCAVCNKSFLEKQSLIRHQKNVCGCGEGAPPSNSSINSSFDLDQSKDSFYSGADNSEISPTSLDDLSSSNFNPSLLAINGIKALNSVAKIKNFASSAATEYNSAAENKDSAEISKDAPSLHSLMKKDPNLYDSISEIVESIDSYEKMLDLCGDSGQRELEAALSRDLIPRPGNLLCFECGEQLVEGENFKSEGKTFHLTLINSFKCLHCEAVEEDADFSEPPVLKVEMTEKVLNKASSIPSPSLEKLIKEEIVEEKYVLPGSEECSNSNSNKNIFGTDETLEHFRERLKVEHGVYFIGDGYSGAVPDETDKQTDIASSNAAVSGSTLTCSEQNVKPDNKAIKENSESQGNNQLQNAMSSLHQVIFGSEPSRWKNTAHKMDYEADDVSIPSVFPCHLCTKVFSTSAFLERHLELHKKSPFKCMVCSKIFTNAASLKRHMTTHTGEKPYTCPYCQKQIRDPSNFSKHKKLCAALAVFAASPANSASSTSPTSSPLPAAADDAGITNMSISQAVFKQTWNSTSPISTCPDLPIQFSYDNDEDEDLPVRFGHVAADSSSQAWREDDVSSNHERNSLTAKDDDTLLIPCPICGKTFGNQHYLEMHMKYHSGNPNVTCIECGKSFADSFGLKRHVRIHAGIRPHVCEYCHRGYCDNWSLKKHKSRGCLISEVKVATSLLHPCPQCNRVFPELDHLHEHTKTHKGMPKFECDICQKRFSEAFNLKRHRRLHMAICPGCDREFKDIQSLSEHQATDCQANFTGVVKTEGFSCNECGRVYSSKAYLGRHKKFHSDLKPYVCDICNKRFSEGFRLRRHMKVHAGNKPFTCEGCGKSFADETGLKRHTAYTSCKSSQGQQENVQQQGVGQDFPCQLCNKVFAKNYLLVRHMNVHSQERPFACDVCERSYKDTSSLRRHQLVHQGIKDFICPICGKDFFYSDSLKRHMTGSCSKPKPRRCRRLRQGKSRAKRKSNNNINIKNNNTIHNKISSSPQKKIEVKKERPASPQKRCQICIPAKDVKASLWSCHKKLQCWRCNLKFSSAVSLLRHARVHKHRKPYYCRLCFLRWTRKFYFKIHLRLHRFQLNPTQQIKQDPVQVKAQVKKLRRSVPRARWSWISQI